VTNPALSMIGVLAERQLTLPAATPEPLVIFLQLFQTLKLQVFVLPLARGALGGLPGLSHRA